jgi:hypothetical protein
MKKETQGASTSGTITMVPEKKNRNATPPTTSLPAQPDFEL